jgi:hypothetical protein
MRAPAFLRRAELEPEVAVDGGTGKVVLRGRHLAIQLGPEDWQQHAPPYGGEPVLEHLGLRRNDHVDFELIGGAVVMRRREEA